MMWLVEYVMRGHAYEKFFRSEREARLLVLDLHETPGCIKATIRFVEDSED